MNYDEHEPLDILNRAKQKVEEGRLEYNLKRFINDEFEKRREWFVVTYQGYDAKQGLHKVRMNNGSVIYAQAKSIPGSVSIGSILVAFRSSGSYTRLFMPL